MNNIEASLSLKFFLRNLFAKESKIGGSFALLSPKLGNLVQGKCPQSGCFSAENLQYF